MSRRAAGVRLGAVLAVAAAGYAAVLLLMWSTQERLIFLGQPLRAEYRFAFGDDVHEAWVDVPGARLHALHLRLPAPDGVVFFLHGNAGNLAGWFADVDFYRRANHDLVMLDYRGYGKSSGRITSQAQLEADVRAAWDTLVPGGPGVRRVIVGQSLGAGLAASLAAEVGPDALVLVTPFESLEALAGEVVPWVPRALLRYPLRTDEALARVAAPVSLIHGDADDVVAFAHSERLHARLPRTRLYRVAGGGHNDLPASPAFHDALREALATPENR